MSNDLRENTVATVSENTNAVDAPSTDLMLEACHVRFGYEASEEEDPILRDISLEVMRGTCVLLVGINGCGKSTFFDCVLGEHVPQAGNIFLAGRSVRSLKAAQMARLVSYVPQVHEHSFPYTVEQIVLMGRTVWSSTFSGPDEDDAVAANEALVQCGIDHLRERPYTSLSGGEMQMVLLARALAQDAPLILMDEPTAHLDFKNELMFLETVEELITNTQTTVLMATHAPNQAFLLDSVGITVKVAVMADGYITRFGTPDEVLSEQMLYDVFGVRSCLLEGETTNLSAPPGEAGTQKQQIRQIVALSTADKQTHALSDRTGEDQSDKDAGDAIVGQLPVEEHENKENQHE